MTAAGLPIELRVGALPQELSPGLDLAVFRVIQEALTNVIKHAGKPPTTVTLDYADGRLEVEVADTGRPILAAAPALPDGAGRGLIGLRERIALYGGELDAGPRSGGGWIVRARFPVDPPRPRQRGGAPAGRDGLVSRQEAGERSGHAAPRGDRRRSGAGAQRLPDDPRRGGHPGRRRGIRWRTGAGSRARASTGRRADGHPDAGDGRPRGDPADPRGPAGASCRIIILTTFDLDQYVYAALTAGASGFLLKDVSPEQLVDAVRTVRSGDALLAPSITRRLVERFASAASAPAAVHGDLSELTPRELEVLQLLARGLSNAELAAELVLSEATVKTHVARILRKLGLRDRVQAVVLAYQTGLAAAHTGTGDC